LSGCAAEIARRKGWIEQERMTEWIAAAMRVVRCIACRREPVDRPITSDDTPGIDDPLTSGT
jgi:hypothetical protein